jgi:hypothetical protein
VTSTSSAGITQIRLCGSATAGHPLSPMHSSSPVASIISLVQIALSTMSRRIDVELTSKQNDGTWTWRAAGAREPKGVLDGDLLAADATVGQVLRADAEFDVEGIEVISVLPPLPERAEPELLEILGSGRNEPDVVTTGVSKRGRQGDRDDKRGGDRKKKPRDGAPRTERQRPQEPEKPKPKRLRPKKDQRNAWLEALPEEQKPVAEQLLLGGIPAVRAAIDKQNAVAREADQPEVSADPLLKMAEDLLPSYRIAEWRDRADAALSDVDELDLRDLRSLLNAAETVSRDEQCRQQAEELRTRLTERVDRDHAAWLTEIAATLADGRTVRALRLSSRPPKAGSPLPADLATRLAAAASAGMSKEATEDRWATVLDAVAFSPVRQLVKPEAIPEKPSDDLLKAVRKLADRVPEIAAAFGIKADERPPRRSRKKVPRPPKPDKAKAGKPAPEKAEEPETDAAKAEEPPPEKAEEVSAAPAEAD